METKSGYFDETFEKLKSSIGKVVTCIYWEFGKMQGYRGVLIDYSPYDFINIEGNIIQFVGERTAIQYILVEEKDVIYSLYSNEKTKDYKGSFRDPMVVINAQKELLGVSVAEEDLGKKHR